MGLFTYFSERNVSKTRQMIEPSLLSLDVAIQLASPFVEDRVKQWDLANRSLMATLGYIAGYIDGAYQMTKPARYNEHAVEHLFNERIAKYLSMVSGVDAYLALSKIGGGSAIGGMQGQPGFMEGMMAGGGDFVNFVNEKRVPLSLAGLLQGDALCDPQPKPAP